MIEPLNNDISKTFGDISAGLSIPVPDIELYYNRLKVRGFVDELDIRQLAGWGIPIYKELSRVLQINIQKVNDYANAGKLDISHIEQCFKNMTSIEGVFHGIEEAQSKSFFRL
jgi:hypothetical protein